MYYYYLYPSIIYKSLQKTSQLSLLIAIYNGMAIYVFGAKSGLFSENKERGEPFEGHSAMALQWKQRVPSNRDSCGR